MQAPPSEVVRVANTLIQRIVDDTYSPGLKLPAEVELAQEFGCGRSTVREAMRQLVGLNLVRSRRGSGVVVLDFRVEGVLELLPVYLQYGRLNHPLSVLVQELFRMRGHWACEAARLAALYAKPSALVAVKRQIEVTHEARDRPVEHALRELEVFRLLTRASSVWPTVWFANQLTRPLREVIRMVADPLGPPPPQWLEVMRQMVELVERSDAQGAVDLVRAYFDSVDSATMSALGMILASEESRGDGRPGGR
jgi:GntR family transcriptional regulator, transcriptional repressor for pyruvate dehydrogenase complex